MKPTKKNTPSESVISLAEVATETLAEAADRFAGHYTGRQRSYVAMGKHVLHMDSMKLPKGVTVYGELGKRGVPQSSVNNARIAARFYSAMVVTGLVSEARADEILTFRVANQTGRIIAGKGAITMTAEQIAPIINEGEKAAIGDELDSLAEHGLTVAAKDKLDKEKNAEAARVIAAAAKAEETAAAPTPPPTEAETTGQTEAEAIADADAAKLPDATKGKDAPPATAPPVAPTALKPLETPAAPADKDTVTDLATFLKTLEAVEMSSLGMSNADMATVIDRIDQWKSLLVAHLENEAIPATAKKPKAEKKAA